MGLPRRAPIRGMPRGARITVAPKDERTRRTRMGEVVFDSKAEARRWDELDLAWTHGEVVLVLLQPVFHLPGNTRYRADFQVFWKDGTVTFEDVKGQRTQSFIRAKKQVEDIYGVEITEVVVGRARARRRA